MTSELSVGIHLDAFLKSSGHSFDEMKLVDAQNVLDATVFVMDAYKIHSENIIYVMTYNRSKMTGQRRGFIVRMKEICVSTIDIPGCSSHQAHLLQKEEISKSSCAVFQKLLRSAESFSSFMSCFLKLQSIIKTSC